MACIIMQAPDSIAHRDETEKLANLGLSNLNARENSYSQQHIAVEGEHIKDSGGTVYKFLGIIQRMCH